MQKINLQLIQNYFKKYFSDNNYPLWFKILNFVSLIPILVWPFIVFGSIFLLDNPKNLFFTLITIILVDAYPLYLILIAIFSFKSYNKNRLISILLPLILIGSYISSIAFLYINAGKY